MIITICYMIITILNPDWLKMAPKRIQCSFVVRNGLGLHLVKMWRQKQSKGLPTFLCRLQIYFFSAEWLPLPFANLSFLLSKLEKYLVGTEARQYVEQIHSNMWSKVEQIHSDKLLTFPVPSCRVQNHPNSKSYNNFVDKEVLLLNIFFQDD